MSHSRNDGNVIDKDEARTPKRLFDKLNSRFHFDIDAFCTVDNCLCPFGFARDSEPNKNAFTMDWRQAERFTKPPVIYGNPPYSNPAPFIEKAYNESRKHGIEAILLLPADTSTHSYHNFCMKANEIWFLEGRVKFDNPDGTPMQGSPKFGSMVVRFDAQHYGPIWPIVHSWDWKECGI